VIDRVTGLTGRASSDCLSKGLKQRPPPHGRKGY
jgi:hypothetical protein